MSDSEFQNVSRVIELRLSTDEVNEYLGKGWILLNTFVEGGSADDGTSQRAVYVLGWKEQASPLGPVIADAAQGMRRGY